MHRPHKAFVLGSGSPQRKNLISYLGIEGEILIPHGEEDHGQAHNPEQLAQILAKDKWNLLQNQHGAVVEGKFILCADTVVGVRSLDDQGTEHWAILGKPENRSHAASMMELLSGRSHLAYTAFLIAAPQPGGGHSLHISGAGAQVFFMDLKEVDLGGYLDSQQWMGAAGGYKIQGAGGAFISHLEGSYSTVVGLPLHELYVTLTSLNFWL